MQIPTPPPPQVLPIKPERPRLKVINEDYDPVITINILKKFGVWSTNLLKKKG